MDTRINLDGSPWGWLDMSFKLEPQQLEDQTQLSSVCDSIFRLTKGEIEFSATERPCPLHQEDVWRELFFDFDSDGVLTARVFVCCQKFSNPSAHSMPQLEAFIKRKLKLPQ